VREDKLLKCVCSEQVQEVDSLRTDGMAHDYYVECICCSKRTAYCKTAKMAVKQWNGMARL
jgi:hypothetical protein